MNSLTQRTFSTGRDLEGQMGENKREMLGINMSSHLHRYHTLREAKLLKSRDYVCLPLYTQHLILPGIKDAFILDE